MPSIDATVGGAASNSFVTVAECDAYCDARLNASAWNDESDDDQKARALIEASRDLSQRQWVGVGRTSSTQALAWPRTMAENPDIGWPGLWYFDSNVIPQRVKDATSELALQFLILGTTDLLALDPTLNVIEKTVDVLTTRYAEPLTRARGLDRFPSVTRFIRPLLVGSSNSVGIVRG